MSRLQAVLSAGAITGVVLLAIIFINLKDKVSITWNGADSGAAAETVTDPGYVEALQGRQEQLDQAASVMGDRQTEFQAQLDAANQTRADLDQAITDQKAQNEADARTITELQPQIAAANGSLGPLEAQAGALQQQEADYAAQIEAANARIIDLRNQITAITGQ
jgi:chromosome segregation ATPase